MAEMEAEGAMAEVDLEEEVETGEGAKAEVVGLAAATEAAAPGRFSCHASLTMVAGLVHLRRCLP